MKLWKQKIKEWDYEWDSLCSAYDYRCLACGEQTILTVDHVRPKSLGGKNHISNYQPLCQKCNQQKGNTWVDYRDGRCKPNVEGVWEEEYRAHAEPREDARKARAVKLETSLD